MAGGIKLEFVADVAPFLRGTDDVEEALDDVASALDGLQEEGSDAARALGDDLERIGRDADDAADKTQKSFKGAFDTLKREADDTGKKVGDDLKKGTDDFKSEAGQSGREAAASFSGGFDDVGDFVQETAANAFSGFGPLGAAAGGAAAIGIGLIVAELDKANQRAEELRQLAADIGEQLRESGEVDLSENLTDYLFENADALDAIRQGAEDVGVSFEDVKAAFLGNEEALARVNAAMDEYGQGIQPLDEYLAGNVQALGAMVDAANDNAEALDLAEEVNAEYASTAAGAADAANLQAEAIEATREAADAAREALSGLIGAENDYYESLEEANTVLAENGESWDASTEAGRENRDAVLDVAEAMHDLTQSQLDAGTPIDEVTTNLEQQRRKLYDLAIEAGATKEEAQQLVDTMLGTPDTINVAYEVDTESAQNEVERFNPKVPPVEVEFDASPWQAQKVVNDSMAKVVSPIVRIRYTDTNPVGVRDRRA